MATRILISEVTADSEYKAGNRRGYPSRDAAFRAAKRLANKTGNSHCVAQYEVVGDERDCLEVLGYEHPDDAGE